MEVPDYLVGKVKIEEDGCWTWNGSVMKSGVPYLYAKNKKQVTARRFIFENEVGIIDSQKIHVKCNCHNKMCVNPEHIFLDKAASVAISLNKKFTEEETKKRRRIQRIGKKEKMWADGERIKAQDYYNKRRNQTHCKHGHSLEDAYITKAGSRSCRVCRRLSKTKLKDGN